MIDSPYLLIPVILLSSISYLLSYLLTITGVIQKTVHRKIWNTLLLLTFISTATLGLLLAVQINYKLEWPFVKSVLKWHVDFGIGMSFVVIVHLIWHFNYYLKIFNSDKKVSISKKISLKKDRIKKLSVYIVLSGFSGIIIQVLLLREITTIYQGNELMIAWSLGLWMVLTGIGAFLGKNSKTIISSKLIDSLLIFLSVLPFVSVIIAIITRNIIFPPGVLIHPGWFVLIVFIVFAPVCLISGWLFSAFVISMKEQKKNFIRVYFLETVGSTIGGLAASFLFIWWLDTLESLLINSILIFTTLFICTKRNSMLSGIIIFALILVSFLLFPINNKLKEFLFTRQKVIESKETWYGNVTITENSGQYNIYENGNLSFTSDNSILSEEYAHYAMLQHNNPHKVLLVSGGITGILNEILKYKRVEKIDFLEPNPHLLALVSEYIETPEKKSIHYLKGDIRRYIRDTKEKYDIVIFAIPDPSSLQLNRMYTSEFIRTVSACLAPGGVVLFGMTSAGNYMGTEKVEIDAALYNILKETFENICIIPGEKDYFIASDSALSIKMGRLSEKMDTINTYVNSYYMDDKSISDRSQFLISKIKENPIINTDDKPNVVLLQTSKFVSMFGQSGKKITLLIPLLLLLLPLLFMGSSARGMFIAGVSASSVEVIIIFIFQLVYGNLYASIGAIIAAFMAGLAIGSFIGTKISKIKFVRQIVTLILTISILILPFCYSLLSNSGTLIGIMILVLNILIPAISIGFLYSIYSLELSVQKENAPSIIYASDLVGSAFGIIAVTVLLIPLLGISNTCYLIAGLNLFPVFFCK